MNDWRKFSRLPESPEYWDGLAARVQQSVHSMPAEPVARERSLAPLAWTAIAATLIAVFASRSTPPEPGTPLSLQSGLAPSDSIAVTWLQETRPPSVAEMLMTRMGGHP